MPGPDLSEAASPRSRRAAPRKASKDNEAEAEEDHTSSSKGSELKCSTCGAQADHSHHCVVEQVSPRVSTVLRYAVRRGFQHLPPSSQPLVQASYVCLVLSILLPLSRSRHVQSLLISAAAPLTTGAPASRRSPLAAPPLRPTGTRTPRQPPPSRDGCRRRPDCSCRCRRRQGELWWLCGGRDAAGGPLGRSPRTRPAPAGREQRAPPKTAA
mmetsp:Transcript_5796/g.21109  ORF Transcript_5796/g.21109 Transcript_5796/m.21109 type:complete len:212 (+) Transcript_5796:328-963(+)